MRSRHLRLLLLAVLAAASLSGRGEATTRDAYDGDAAVAALPASYASWHVSAAPSATNPQMITVSFDSPLLHQRVSNVVWLPTSYGRTGGKKPGVVYYLHGTSYVDLEPLTPALEAAHDQAGIDVDEATPFGGYFAGAHQFSTLLDRQSYLVVVLDTQQPRHWCSSCWWVDGRNGAGVAAESHLYKELIPLVQALFDVRTDRGGRGILGHSMGGTGALIQGFRHPDRFAFIGSTGGTIPGRVWEHQWNLRTLWPEYLRGQGYGTDITDEVAYRNINPLDLAPQMAGQNVDIVMAMGDGCEAASTRCTVPSSVGGGRAFADDGEADYRRWTEPASEQLTELGVPHFFVKRQGTHVGEIFATYSQIMLDRINRVFAEPVPVPRVFSYKTVDRAFSIWGYDVSVERPNNEFLNLVGARTDGSSFVLAGTGRATVHTPPAFVPGRSYDVSITRESAEVTHVPVTADETGRLTIDLDLGATRSVDERRELLDAGDFPIPQTLVDVAG